MVPVALARASVAPLGEESESVSASFGSTVLSPGTCTCTSFEVSPEAKVSVPLVAV
jgi:hypothetical protein